MNLRTYRLIRQVHIWVGAWGALAAVLFGVTGFLQNHRAILKLPQGSSTEVSQVELAVPEYARGSPEALRSWFVASQHVQLELQRRPEGPRQQGERAMADRGGGGQRSSRWTLSGGNARITLQAEYIPGAATATLRTSVQSPLAVLAHLHKGVGGGVAWILLSDSFAVGMVALGLSGLIMWSRGRSPRQMIVSIAAVAVVVLVLVGGGAVL